MVTWSGRNGLFRPSKWFEYFRQVLVFGEYRGGKLVGIDKDGNRYYEVVDEAKLMPFRNRYVEYSKRPKDASQVPAEWHGWLHSIVDEPPTTAIYSKSIADVGHLENVSGTSARYVPYSTVKPKINEAFKYDDSKVVGFRLAERIRKIKK